VEGELLEAGGERAAVLEDADSVLDDSAPAVADGVVANGAAAGLAAGRNDGADAVVAQPLAVAAGVVDRVATDPAGPTAGAPHPAWHAHPARAPRTGSPHALSRGAAARSAGGPSHRRCSVVP
jgi:hypothetical protein